MQRIIIGGLPRCGTTLLASLINAQERCTFVTTYLNAFAELSETLHVRYDEPLGTAQRKAALLKAREQMLAIRHPLLLTPDDFSTLADLHRRALEDIAADGDVLVGHKALLTPGGIDRILEGDPAVRVVILLRDPRDAAVSWWYRTGSRAEPYIEEWKRMVRYTERRAHSRLRVIKLEDLVSAPEATLGTFLAHPSVPSSLVAFRDVRARGERWTPNTAHRDITRVLDPQAIERWRQNPDSPLVRYADWACQDEIGALGYATGLRRPRPRELSRFIAIRSTERLASATRAAARRIEEVLGRLRPALAP